MSVFYTPLGVAALVGVPVLSLGAGQLTSCGEDPGEPTPPLSCEGAIDLEDQLAASVARSGGYGGGVIQVDGPCGVRYAGASGQATAQGTPMWPEMTFEVASVSKTFTAVVVLQLVEEGGFTLDTPIGRLLPAALLDDLLVIGGHDYSGEITPRQLLNHTSGLADHWTDPPYVTPGVNAFLAAFMADPEHFWPPEEVLSYVPELLAHGRPGSSFHYSDSGYVLLGLLIEAREGAPLHEVFRARLFEPLRMTDTYLSYREAPTSEQFESHRYEADWDMYGKTHQSADWASGGLVSSTRDLSTFIHALAAGELFSNPDTLAEMKQDVPTGTTDVTYGLGIFRIALDDGGELWGHDGYGNAFMYHSEGDGHVYVGTLNQTENDWWPLVLAGVNQVR